MNVSMPAAVIAALLMSPVGSVAGDNRHGQSIGHSRHVARHASHRVSPVAVVPAAGNRDDPYSPYAYPGAANRAMARRNQDAPGLTNELAPDAKATASGGPAGGVPGFDGD